MYKKYIKSFFLDRYAMLLFLLTTFCFIEISTIATAFIIGVSLFQFYRLNTKKISPQYFFSTYFYLLIYACIYNNDIFKIILIILLLFFGILFLMRNKSKKIKEKYTPEIIVLSFFMLITINHLIFPPYLKGLDIYIYYLLIPLLFLGIKKYSFPVSKIRAIKVFISSVLISSILLSFINLFNKTFNYNGDTFFPKYLGLTHVYYGMFLGVANCFILFLHDKKKEYLNSVCDAIIFFFFSLLLVYSGARIALFSLIFICFLYAYKKIPFHWHVKSVLFVFVFLGVFFYVSKTPRVKQGVNDIKTMYNSIQTNNKKDLIANSWKNMNQRFLITTYTVSEIKERPFLGIGMQNITDEISKKVIKDGYKYFNPINSHNQYLHFLVGMGCFALLCFLLLIFYFGINAPDSIYFLVFFLIIMLTESILVRGKGISLFFLFLLLFSLTPSQTHD